MVETHGPPDVLGLVGTTIDQVRFDACVDGGGFGLIYRGYHEGLDEVVAIKCLRIASIQRTNEDIRQALAGRFRDETKLLYRLSQGNLDIVRCISSGTVVAPKTNEYTPYMVLEWLDGCTLSTELRQRREQKLGGRSLEDAVTLLDSAVGGIAYAHAHEVVHRDIKPGNLFLTRTREGVRMKVLDFGLAKILDDDAIGIRPSVETGVGVHFCSPSYGAPEQYAPQIGKVGPWTDVYSLCLVLYEVMIGEKVRPAGSLAEGLLKAIDPARGSPSASDLGLTVSRAVEHLLKQALAQNPQERPRDAGLFWAALKEAMAIKGELNATVMDDSVYSAMQQVRDAAVLRAAAAQPSPFAGTMLMQNAPAGAPHLVIPVPLPAAGRPPTPGAGIVPTTTAPLEMPMRNPPPQAQVVPATHDPEAALRIARLRAEQQLKGTIPINSTQSPLAASMAVPSPLHNNAPSSGPPPAYQSGPPPNYAQQQQQQQQQQQEQQQQQQQQQSQQRAMSSYPPGGAPRVDPRATRTDPRMGLVVEEKKSSAGTLMAVVALIVLAITGATYYWLRVRGH